MRRGMTYKTINSDSGHVGTSELDKGEADGSTAVAGFTTDHLHVSDLAELGQVIAKALLETGETKGEVSDEDGAAIDLVTLQPDLGGIQLSNLGALLLIKGDDTVANMVTESLHSTNRG